MRWEVYNDFNIATSGGFNLSKKRWTIILILLFLLSFLGGCSTGSSTVKEQNVLSLDNQKNDSKSGQLEICFIDCGQGDAILIKTPAGEYMLVDGGNSEEGDNISKFLRNQGVKQLAVIVGTHPHSDHIGGLAKIIDSFPVEKVYLPRVTHNTSAFETLLNAIKSKNLKINTARQGVEIPLEGIGANFIAPVGEKYEDLNNYSAVIRIDYGDNSFILTGDAEEFSEKEMLASEEKLKADVLKVGHHGSASSTCPGFFKAVAPQYAVIMCGVDNDYGHPHREILAALEASGVKVYRTDLHGTIIMKSDGHDINIETTASNNNTSKPTPEQKQESIYIGNKNSLKLHCSDCKSLPYEKNRVYFKNRDEAIDKGYLPCSQCQP